MNILCRRWMNDNKERDPSIICSLGWVFWHNNKKYITKSYLKSVWPIQNKQESSTNVQSSQESWWVLLLLKSFWFSVLKMYCF